MVKHPLNDRRSQCQLAGKERFIHGLITDMPSHSAVCLMFLFLCSFSVSASGGDAVGFLKTTVSSQQKNQKISVAVVYPSNGPSKAVTFGPFTMNLALNTPVADGKFPLAVISHGSGGSSLGHRSIAFALVKRGFIVAMPLHPENNFQNNSAEGTVDNWRNRPVHITSVIDAILVNSKLSKSLDVDKIAIIGHSAGGYTALAVAGGAADTQHIIDLCEGDVTLNEPFCALVKDNKVKPEFIDNPRDKRVKAIVLMAPVGILFKSRDSLAQVDIPALLLRAGKDDQLTEPFQSEVIAKNYRNKEMLTYRTIENAGHYSFITPFPKFMKGELGAIAQDPRGFDRKKFHQNIGQEIGDYLDDVLK